MSDNFDPSGVAVQNGQFMGLTVTESEAETLILPIPWDVTTSYRAGTVHGPQAVLEASCQLDFGNSTLSDAWTMKVHTLPIPQEWFEKSQELRKLTENYIHFLEQGGDVETDSKQQEILAEANLECEKLFNWSYQTVLKHLKVGKRVFTLGGDHAVPLGPIKAYAEMHPNMSILHFDAHADLRFQYEGFKHSHASIMNNVLSETAVEKIVQIGIRDVSPFEMNISETNPRVKTYYDWDIQERLQTGESWSSFCAEVVSQLSQEVYVSFDIDGLDPKLCPHTGTPVPGGLEFSQAVGLIKAVQKSGRKIIGADVVEVAPHPERLDEWDGNVGARLLFQILCCHFESLK